MLYDKNMVELDKIKNLPLYLYRKRIGDFMIDASRINVEKLRTVLPKEPFVCLYSGGKDSALALSIACQYAQPYALVHSAGDDGFSYNHKYKADVIQSHADAMGIPLTVIKQNPKSNKFLHKLIVILKGYVKQGVQSMVTGTLYDLPSYEFNIKVAEIAGVKLCCPLWGLSSHDMLDGMEKHGIECVICTI